MTKTRSDARGQHYVPQMLQDAFTRPGKGKKPQLFVFDKHEDRVFKTSPENILHQRDFNTFESEEASYCLETGMGKVEDAAAPVLRHLLTLSVLQELDVHLRVRRQS
ncbi:hypothetical protein ASD89_01945 [Caulobacter sp. Root656]|uniref:DUF4238 domain-containing protein n=1 Tax=Caulobacter sp. Root1472 TaxID=1736470 RepID=UPI0006F5F211|nr:DUF4238 domain-containing protein [Caulobacter sp. Root1472]KQZ28339.1 hypothetical protein ASD47_22170 [Caulobacter sp. Root1472]KRA67011.1 hypothetical protein ASD89_01945 [Caulobacter sp. Root656]